ncbi:MAG: hypothetical protein LBC59_03075 [Chitinispirillales bacterium]|nr:hypothetical protein [Chitinispirillales bacterium]
MRIYGYRKIVFAYAFAAAFAFAAPVFAQEGGWGSDVEDFSGVQAPVELKTELGEGDPDFGAALEAAAAAEELEAKNSEHIPKNEISVVKKTDSVAAAPKAEKKKKEKRAGSGEKLGHTMGGRLGIGSEIEVGFGLNIGLTDVNRLGFGINMGLGLVHGGEVDGFGFFESYALYEWRFNISEELSWFAGAGGVIGYHNAWWKETVRYTVPPDTTVKQKKEDRSSENPFGIAVGGRAGIEVDLSFIDPDHALSWLRSSLISLDVRPMLFIVKPENYDRFVMTIGINYSYVLGRAKSKETKDNEKK